MDSNANHYLNMLPLADDYYKKGRIAYANKEFEKAESFIQNALYLYKNSGMYDKYTESLNLMGVIFTALGNSAIAINYYLDGLESALAHECNNILSLFYNNIGTYYQELNEHEKAIEFFLKSEDALEHPQCKKEVKHPVWCQATYINLATSYLFMKNYDAALKYLTLTEQYITEENKGPYHYTYLILKCQLLWAIGQKDFVYDHLEELLESGTKNENAPDYSMDIRQLCSLLKDMKEYHYWKDIIQDFEEYTSVQNSVYHNFTLTEMWMDYYQTIGETEKYNKLCVEYVELNRKQKAITDKDRATAIDIKIQLKKNERELQQREKLSTTDALTGLGNRYLIARDISPFIKEAFDNQRKIAVGILDIDYFKQYNDTYGHIAGDACIRQIAKILQSSVEESGKVYRFGGDEFIILLSCGEYDFVEQIAKKVQNEINEANIKPIASSETAEVTISQGYACFVPNNRETLDSLINYADQALYYVKKHNRNAYHIIGK